MHTWTQQEQPLKLEQRSPAADDPDPKALACYGCLLRRAGIDPDQMLRRFVDGQPCGAITMQYLAWLCSQLAQDGLTVLFLIWDNASWHKSHAVRAWIKAHNYLVKHQAARVPILPFLLPVKSPWLNPIEPKWVHGKRAVVAPDRILPALELARRVCGYFDCSHEPHFSIP